LVGAAAAALITYLPLYAEEEIGLSVTAAAAVASVYGLAGLFSRLAFPPLGEKARHLAYPMLLVVALAVTGTVFLWLSQAWGAAWLWVGAALVGVQVAWTALGMLAVITHVDQHQAGRASGVVSRGFGIGLAAGPPIFGFTVDKTGAYHLGFAFILVVMVGSAVLMLLWAKSEQTSAASG
jgi:cyanate permease